MPVGNRCILTHPKIVSLINAATHNQYLDKTQSSGIQVWFKNIKDADKFKTKIAQAFKQHEIQNYWKVSTYQEYDFAKDLLQQFQSDRYLFTLVGVIILIVACCNIISMLVILVNDKKEKLGSCKRWELRRAALHLYSVGVELLLGYSVASSV
jgi:lipoprotein-releasing system permease protein